MAEKRVQYIDSTTMESFPAPEAGKIIKRNDSNDGWENIAATLGQQQESVSATDAQTVFTLSEGPLGNGYVQMFINGFKQRYGTDYTQLGTSVTYTGSPTIISTDGVEFWYVTSGSIIAGGVLTQPTSPDDDGYIPVASGGDFTYLSGDADGDVLTWNDSTQAWESQIPSGGGIGPNTMTITSTTQTTQTTGWTTLSAFEFDPLDYDGYTTIEFRALIETTNAADDAEIRIFNLDTATEVSGTLLSTSSTSTTLVSVDIETDIDTSSSIYEVQIRLATTGSPNTCICKRAELRIE